MRKAKREGVRVIAYDRLIKDADVDLYITFDNERVGEMMSDRLQDLRPVPPHRPRRPSAARTGPGSPGLRYRH